MQAVSDIVQAAAVRKLVDFISQLLVEFEKP
jgi:hypothetical protein